jgi:hypothetical protein
MARIKQKSEEHRNATASAFANAQAHIEQETRLELKRQDLEQMSPAQLVDRYIWLEKGVVKDRLQQCKILREIRVKFGDDDRRFGEFLSQTLMSELNPKMITRMIQVADFFETKPIDGIVWTSALALAEPRNAPVALQAYKEVAGKDIRPVDVVHLIDAMMGRVKPVKVIQKSEEKAIEEPEKGSIEGEYRHIREESAPAQQETVIDVPQTPALPEIAESSMVMRHVALDNEKESVNSDNLAKRHDLLLKLLDLDATHLTEEQLKAEAKLLANSWRVSFMKQGALLIEAGKEILDKGYGK